MRGLRSTVALLALLIGLGAYVYFVASKTDNTTTLEKLFEGIDAATIAELKVKSSSGDVTTLKKEGSTWKILTPVAMAAAATDATGIANVLASLDIVRVVEEVPTDLTEYGLNAPKIEIDFKSTDGKASGRLLVGEVTATGGNLYARRDDQKRVVLIGQHHESSLNKSTFDLRDKTVVKFDRSAVDGLEVTLAGKALAQLAKSGSEWRMTKPFSARADSLVVDGLIGQIESLQMISPGTSAPTADDLKKFGLDAPRATFSLHLGSARATLTIGTNPNNSTVYVRESSRPDVFAADISITDETRKVLDDYRKKEPFDFRTFSVNHIEVTRGGQTVVIDRVKAADANSPDTWRRVSPTPGDPDREKVEKFLSAVADTRITSFVDARAKTGLESPAAVVMAKFDEGTKEERVTFGKNGVDVFVSRSDDYGAGKIDAQKFDEAMKALDEISK